MPALALDSLQSYAAAVHVLNRVLGAEYERTNNFDSLYFISVSAELEEGAAGVVSHDPAYWPNDWSEALGQTGPVEQADAYAALLRFVAAFVVRGCDDSFRAAIARLDAVEDGLPRDPELLRWWTEAWEKSARAGVRGAVLMTRSPFLEPRRWRAGEGWTS
jgi:hypothetical protein